MRTSRRTASAVLPLVLAALVSGGCARPARPVAAPTPPPDEGRRVEARSGVVTSANGLASDAGLEVLRAGGNAVDAAVATAFAIGVVEPQMSGLGGSGAALVWMKRDGTPAYLDFYAAQNADSFRGHTGGEPGPADLRIVGIPGDVAGLVALHERWGVLPLARDMAPAIRLARDGFPIGDILAGFIAADSAKLSRFPAAFARFWPGGRPLRAGTVLRNLELAESLERVARGGRNGFYDGETAERVVEALNAGNHPATRADLRAYEPQWKRPLCAGYHGLTVLSAPPPQYGLQVLHTLELLEPFDLRALGLPTRSAPAFDVLVSALRVGQADAEGNSDPNWVPVPAAGIASAAFAGERRRIVGRRAATDSIAPASARPFDQAPPAAACARYEPYGAAPAIPAASERPERQLRRDGRGEDGDRRDEPSGETTHISVVDHEGNAVSLTQTNSTTFGSGAYVAGFFLNDSGFRFTEGNVDAPSRSRWRVRTTTISPTLVLQGGEVRMVVGAPGSARIPTEIVQVMVYTLDYGMDPLAAVRMPRIFPSPGSPRVQLEHGFTPELLRDVRAMGYDPVPPSPGYARLYMIVRRGDEWIGVADPRHDGQARGY